MSKGPEINKANIRKVLVSLFKGPKSWTELKTDTQIDGRLVSRILKEYLSYWYLVHKDDNGKWAFNPETPIFETFGKHIALQHYREIMNDLFSYKRLKNMSITDFYELSNDIDEITIIDETNPSIWLLMLRNHLKTGYKITWKTLMSYEKLSKHYDYPRILVPSLEQAFNRKGTKRELLKTIDAEIEEPVIPEKDKEMLEQLKKSLIGDLAEIQRKVFTGNKLEGYCEYCPHIEREK